MIVKYITPGVFIYRLLVRQQLFANPEEMFTVLSQTFDKPLLLIVKRLSWKQNKVNIVPKHLSCAIYHAV